MKRRSSSLPRNNRTQPPPQHAVCYLKAFFYILHTFRYQRVSRSPVLHLTTNVPHLQCAPCDMHHLHHNRIFAAHRCDSYKHSRPLLTPLHYIVFHAYATHNTAGLFCKAQQSAYLPCVSANKSFSRRWKGKLVEITAHKRTRQSILSQTMTARRILQSVSIHACR